VREPAKEIDPELEDVIPIHKGGKTRMIPNCTLESVADLRKIYTPGVALVSRLINKEPEKYLDLTSVGNTVGILTNGTAVLGLGDVGVRAAMPVMEGKAVILMDMVDISAVPLLVDTHDPKEFVNAARLISSTFGAILLEDISAPMCFEVESELKKTLDVPVFHDDQHGTAVVVLGALIKALRFTGQEAEDINAVISGAGAAGWAIARFLLNYGVRDVVLCDSRGAIYEGRKDGMNYIKQKIAASTNRRRETGRLEDVMVDKNLFVGVSVADIVSKEMVQSMAENPIVFAMANPVPEIWPRDALDAGAAVATDGRNLNNALGFPGIFRGTLDAQATEINEEMKLAASKTLAELAPTDELVPDFMDKAVHRAVADAVAAAARESGVAR
jgi:malate dehydrogenase (oxaloacetate-decarboxylating)